MKFLILSSFFEIIWVNLLKTDIGFFNKWVHWSLLGVTMILSLYFLAEAAKSLPLTFAYAVWTSSGLIGTALVQHLFFQNHLAPQSWLAVALIVAGIFLFQPAQAQ